MTTVLMKKQRLLDQELRQHRIWLKHINPKKVAHKTRPCKDFFSHVSSRRRISKQLILIG